MGLQIWMCQDHTMNLEGLVVLAADHSSYWLAGVLTVIASLVVVAVMLISSHNDNGESP